MHITGFHIDGFGVFHDAGINSLPPGLIVFVGANESGKSTLMEFFRTVLFGLKRRPANQYEPLHGGNHGGRLSLTTEDGRDFILSRNKGTPGVCQGTAPVEKIEPGKILFPGLDRKTFERVFAIGLNDLQGLEVLSGDDVQGSLFSAGTGLGAASLPGTLKSLNSEIEQILKPRGSAQEIPRLLREIREIERQLAQLQQAAGEYTQLCQQRESLGAGIDKNRKELDVLDSRVARLDQLERARQPWTRIRELRKTAAELEPARTFPRDGLVRYEGLKDKLEELQLARDRHADELATTEEDIKNINVATGLLEQREAISRLVGERAKIDEAQHDCPALESRLVQLQEEYDQRLADLGPGWTSERLDAVDTSVQVQNRVREFAGEVDAARAACQRSGTRAEDAAAREAQLAEAAEETRHQVTQMETDSEVDRPALENRRGALIEIRGIVQQSSLCDVRLQSLDAQARDARNLRKMAAEKAVAATSDRTAVLLRWVVPAFCLILAVVIVILFGQTNPLATGVIGLLLGALALGSAGGSYWMQLKRQGEFNAGQSNDRSAVKAAEERIAELDGEIEQVRQEQTNFTEKLASIATAAGIEPPSDATALEHAVAACEQQAQRLRDLEEGQRSAEAAEKAAQRARRQTEELREQKAELEQQRDKLLAQWHAWLGERGFAALDRPDQFEVVLGAIDSARTARRNVQQQEHRLATVRDYLEEARERLGRLLQQLGRTPLGKSPGAEDIDSLARDLDEAADKDSQLKNLKEKAERARNEADRLATQCGNLDGQIRQLWQQAGASDEEAFRVSADNHRQLVECEKEISENRVELSGLAGSDAALREIEEELARTDPVRLEQETSQTRLQRDQLREDLATMQRDTGSLGQRIDDMSNDARLGESLLRRNQLREQLGRCLRRWSELVLCRETLEQARKIHEEERQPQVFQLARSFLQAMTSDRYQLHATMDNSVVLRGEDHSGKEQAAWSSGLADQTYLAIRLGLAREFGRHAEPLPVILDDVLVRFDLQRRADTLRVVLRYAAGGQIFLFSCRHDLVEELARVRTEKELCDIPLRCYEISGANGASEFRAIS